MTKRRFRTTEKWSHVSRYNTVVKLCTYMLSVVSLTGSVLWTRKTEAYCKYIYAFIFPFAHVHDINSHSHYSHWWSIKQAAYLVSQLRVYRIDSYGVCTFYFTVCDFDMKTRFINIFKAESRQFDMISASWTDKHISILYVYFQVIIASLGISTPLHHREKYSLISI